ncbi:laccase [Rickenella mellea]|uniref:Laccase n=1 Tax=Rickenella mellea TaxID=50990 RepID=A0A4Y7PVB1_9AGAM|nr:laccase [Rickenella mellea]
MLRFTFVHFIPLVFTVIIRVSALTRDLNIVNANISPDGFSRSAVLAEGTFPGPLLTGNKGDSYELNVVNQLSDNTMLRSTSIHWHGFFQHGTNWADGPSFVNQCPIAANNSFLYNFTVPDQAGTFWYHSHLSTQYCDGLRGPFVVYDPNDPHADLYDVDDATTVITLADWYHTPAKSAGKFPTADSTLINGLGRYSGGPSSDLAVISVTQGKRYRFRLVSTSCDPNFVFSIDNHTMTIIEADGVSTNPVEVDSIQIYAGQRYSFVLTANQSVDNFWIRANPNLGTTGFDGGINSAILRYSGADAVDPTTNQTTSVEPLNETDLSPLENPAAPGTAEIGGADKLVNLALAFDTTNFVFTINGVSFTPPTAPVLLQILSGTQDPNDLLPAGSVIGLPGNSVIELSLPGGIPGGGHTFSVIRSAGSDQYNYANPVRRDVVNIGGSGDNVTIRFTTDNPGPWFLHCHIDWHLEIGLAIVFSEDTGNVASTNPVPDAWNNLCPIYNNLTSDQL